MTRQNRPQERVLTAAEIVPDPDGGTYELYHWHIHGNHDAIARLVFGDGRYTTSPTGRGFPKLRARELGSTAVGRWS